VRFGKTEAVDAVVASMADSEARFQDIKRFLVECRKARKCAKQQSKDSGKK
jgi:hypothetical protein